MPRHPVDPELLLVHSDFVRRVARALTKNEADADDLAQDTYAAALDRGPSRPGPLRPWLWGVLRHRAQDAKRRRARRARREERAASPERLEDVSHVAARAELGRQVVGAVMKLREPYRTAVLLRHHDGLAPRQIAARLGVPVETVRTQVRRGLAEVRARLSQDHRGRASLGAALLALAHPQGASTLVPLAGVVTVKNALILSSLLLAALAIWQVLPTASDAPVETTAPETAEGPVLRGQEPTPETTPPHTGAARIEGRVLDDGTPTNARIELRPIATAASRIATRPRWTYEDLIASRPAIAETQADTEGRFRFADVAEGRYELRAFRDGRIGSAALHVPRDGARVSVTIQMSGGAVLLRGRALHADGRPFQGHIRVHHGAGRSEAITVGGPEPRFGTGFFPVGSDGRFVVQGVSKGRAVLSAFVPGEVRYVSPPVVLPHEGEFTFVVDRDAAELRGRVVRADNGEPIRGADVFVHSTQTGIHRSFLRVTTDAEGAFVAHVAGTDLGLRVEARGYASARVGTRLEEPITTRFHGVHSVVSGPGRDLAPLRRPVLVRLEPAAALRGVVRAAQGPVVGVRVYAAPLLLQDRTEWFVATTDAQGRYELDGLPPVETVVFAAGPGWISAELQKLSMSSGHDRFTLTLEPGSATTRDLPVVASARVAGRVLDAADQPASSCVVHAGPGAFPFPTQTLQAPAWLGVGVTAQDGSFVVDPLLPGFAHKLFAVAPNEPMVVTEALFVTAEEREPIEIRLPGGVWIDVRVTDASSGAPIPGAVLRLGGGRNVILSSAWHADAAGVARAGPLPPAEHYLAFVQAPGFLGGRRPVTITPVERVDDVPLAEVALEPAAVVSGQVTAPPGVSVTRAMVALLESRTWRKTVRWRRTRSVRVGPDGRFRIPVKPDGTYRVLASLQWDVHDLEAESETLAPGDDTTLVLESKPGQTTWALEVTDASGQEVARARVRYRIAREGTSVDQGVVALQDGRAVFRTEGKAREVSVTVFAARGTARGPASLGVLSDHRLDPAGGESRVVLPAARALQGRVTSDGSPVSGLKLSAVPVAWPHGIGNNAFAETRTDEDGAFQLTGLGDGDYEIRIQTGYAYMGKAPVRAAGGATDIRIELEPSVGPTVTVLDPSRRPTNGVRVELRLPGTPLHDPITRRAPPNAIGQGTGNDGKARLRDVVPDTRHDLHIVPRNTAWASQVIPDWMPTDTTIELQTALTITGYVSVKGTTGRNVIWQKRAGHAWAQVRLEKGNRFTVPGLSPGERVRLFASGGVMPPSGDGGEGTIEAEAGATGVELVARVAVNQVVRIAGWKDGWESVLVSAVPKGISHALVGAVQSNGTATLYRLEAGREYALSVGPTPDGQFCWIPSFRASGEPITLRLSKGETLEGRLVVPKDATFRNAFIRREGVTITLPVNADGSFRLEGLRPGPWRVFAYALRGMESFQLSQVVRTGEPTGSLDQFEKQ